MHIQRYVDAVKTYAPKRTNTLEIATALRAKSALGIHHTTGALVVLDGYAVRSLCPELLALSQTREVPADADFDSKLEIAAANMQQLGIPTTIEGGGDGDLPFTADDVAALVKGGGQ